MYETFYWFMVFGAFGSFLLLVAESLATTVLAHWAFRLGPVVLRATVPGRIEFLPVGHSLQTHSGKAKVVGPAEALFRHKYRLFSISTPFPIKCTLTLDTSPAVVGCVPLGSVRFLAVWLFGWSVGALFIDQPALYRFGFLLLSWLFVAFMVVISLPLELRRARRALNELVNALEEPAALQGAAADRALLRRYRSVVEFWH